MSDAAADIAVSAPAPQPAAKPLERLWRRFLKARGARVGLVFVGAFGLVAFLAPFLAHRLPIVWWDEGGLSFPLIREFFAPSDTTEPFLERGINFLFVFIPLALLAWLLMNRYLPRLARVESRALSLLFGALFSAAIWFSIGGMVVQGGGKDWFHFENPPVPEIDDLTTSGNIADILRTAGSTETGRLANQALSGAGFDPGKLEDNSNDAVSRRLIAPLQHIIEGPALAPLSAVAIDRLDITEANLDSGINTARWNRLVVENAYPGLLPAMRQFRDTFLALVAASLLALLGLTYIFLAGANQYALSPRWLVLLILALAVSIPFQGSTRHDHTQYRRLAEEGSGKGLFPLIPYGPNEQGFGPRLPPSWYTESPRFTAESVRSWSQLGRGIDDSTPAGELLSQAVPGWRASIDDAAERERILAALNTILDGDTLLDAEATERLRGDISLGAYLAELRAGRTLTRLDRERMNRLLLEKAAPGAFNPVAAVRWKKPRHTPGVHVLGTDESGRDVLVRVIHGARVSLSVGFVSVFLATVIGLVMGSLAAYYGGWVDMAISRFLEIMMCFPSFFLILAVIAVLDRRSIINIMLVIGLTSWTGVARLIRGEMLRQKKMDYVSASIALGAPDTRTIFRHILPNAMAPVLVSISFGITGAILTEAGLSFIGFGVTPPTPTWGQLLSETRDSPLANWWLALFPGVVLFFSVIAYNLVGEALRDALDPRTTL